MPLEAFGPLGAAWVASTMLEGHLVMAVPDTELGCLHLHWMLPVQNVK